MRLLVIHNFALPCYIQTVRLLTISLDCIGQVDEIKKEVDSIVDPIIDKVVKEEKKD
jgi:hypothetical protein